MPRYTTMFFWLRLRSPQEWPNKEIPYSLVSKKNNLCVMRVDRKWLK
ncbi:MAG TPA: hypothetical protein VEK08_00355 [Planctomycetota bacterium]|nr:hypothetical protein [Planctomycetota bacterium]